MKHRKKSEKGFSLMESLFAIFLVAICASIIAATLPVANTSRARADYLNKATNIAQKQLEAIKAGGYSSATGDGLFALGLLDSPAGLPTTPPWKRFEFSNTDSANSDAPSQVLPQGKGFVLIRDLKLDLKQVTVKVEWKERGTVRDSSLSAYIGNF